MEKLDLGERTTVEESYGGVYLKQAYDTAAPDRIQLTREQALRLAMWLDQWADEQGG